MDILSTTIMEILCILKITGFLSYVHVFICSCIISISNMMKKTVCCYECSIRWSLLKTLLMFLVMMGSVEGLNE